MKKLKLHEFSKRALEAREMNNLIGGSDEWCGCGCHGPSSTSDNGLVNRAGGLESSSSIIWVGRH